MTAVLASRLELEADTILEGIEDEARRQHASRVLLSTIETLADHESRRPVADALDEVVRTMEQVGHGSTRPKNHRPDWLLRSGLSTRARGSVSSWDCCGAGCGHRARRSGHCTEGAP